MMMIRIRMGIVMMMGGSDQRWHRLSFSATLAIDHSRIHQDTTPIMLTTAKITERQNDDYHVLIKNL